MSNKHRNWLIAQFPESLFPCSKSEYYERVIQGKEIAANSSCVIAGIGRNLFPALPYTLARIEKTTELFSNSKVIIYENDSNDGTSEYLLDWKLARWNKDIFLAQEKLNKIRHEQDKSEARRRDMADYRNLYLRIIKEECEDYDYTIIIDMDLLGGWSYEGLLNSLSYQYDVIGSNSLLFREREGNKERLFYDTWAFRKINHEEAHDSAQMNLLRYNRGEEPIEVFSAFGGLGIYNTKVLLSDDVWYSYEDCDHPTLHKKIRSHGYKIWINPSQITLYNKHRYVI